MKLENLDRAVGLRQRLVALEQRMKVLSEEHRGERFGQLWNGNECYELSEEDYNAIVELLKRRNATMIEVIKETIKTL